MSAAPALGAADVSRCHGLSSTQRWDEPGALRGELHTADRLMAHALEVARSHGTPLVESTRSPLEARFSTAKARIRDAYALLTRSTYRPIEPSPAEEWLLDNSHVVEEQLREIDEDLPTGYLERLPRIAEGAMRGFPRAYGICIDYLRHTDAHVDLDTLARYTNAYQVVSTLSIGELWAIPIMLRLGLVLTVGALAASEVEERDRGRAMSWAKRLIEHARTSKDVTTALDAFEQSEPPATPTLLVELLRRLRDHDLPLVPATKWVHERCAAMDTTLAELSRKEHLRQAADQVSVGNAVTSMRTISALDWKAFFERTSAVEAILRRDPTGVYPGMDDRTRDDYRRTVEDLAWRSDFGETDVASAALNLALDAYALGGADVESHVGYWLLDAGSPALEKRVAYRPTVRERVVRLVVANASLFYLVAIAVFTTGAVACVTVALHPPVAISVLVTLPASELAVGLVNALALMLTRPRILPKLAHDTDVPDANRTLVVVPTLIDSPSTIRTLLERLEIRALANPDAHLHFALLTDFADNHAEHAADDDELLEELKRGIAALATRYGKLPHRFILMHRRRVRCATQGCYMGWERKRGKLEELNRLLRGADDTTFVVVTAPRSLLESIRYVITLDGDTELPRDTARKLVATIAHPLVAPHFDVASRRIVRGHAIVQPRVGTLPASARRSRYAHISAGPSGIDPYTTACSDVYQDLFGEGSFVGKGIYHVDAFAAVMQGRARTDRILSHDLFEGIFAHSALATDIEVLDDQPASYAVSSARTHRWVRGDWQLLPFLFRGGLRAIDVWRIVDNLRRSALAPALVVGCAVGWLYSPAVALTATMATLTLFALPVIMRGLASLVRTAREPSPAVGGAFGSFRRNAAQAFLDMVFLLDSAVVGTDAIVRTLVRLSLSKRRLLEWTTTSDSVRAFERVGRRLRPRIVLSAAASCAAMAFFAVREPTNLVFAAPLLALWAFAPIVDVWLSQPLPKDIRSKLSRADQLLMRSIARKTWHFFEEFVGPSDHHLPPDNYQEAPRGVVAHRTSPTNIGLYLMSVVAARDFGFISLRDVATRLERTLSTIEGLERRDGHILNWYDTTTLEPLAPRYVSTVDSGNLVAYLWALRQACGDVMRRPIAGAEAVAALADALRLAKAGPSAEALIARCDAAPSKMTLAAADALLESLLGGVRKMPTDRDDEGAQWIERAVTGLVAARADVSTLAPFVESLREAPASTVAQPAWERVAYVLAMATSPRDIVGHHAEILASVDALTRLTAADEAFITTLRERVERSFEACATLIDTFDVLGRRAVTLADGMNFKVLYDDDRRLFAVGYNVETAQLDKSHYDLLASEARLASLVAIAKDDAPQEHWFRLSRLRTTVASHQRALLSWSGSMFEYLMPLLVTRMYDETLLAETCEAAVARQSEYGHERGVPWGISESAFNMMDLGLTYQYRAFGVPGLGLKAGLADDLVVAPYATALAALVQPSLAAGNFRALARVGGEGRFGFYDAIDYTKTHVPPKRTHVVVKTLMAHHQGMVLVALDNVLHGDVMQERFHRDPRVKATALLLEERIPTGAPVVSSRASSIPKASAGDADYDVVEHVGLRSDALTRVHLLGHGELTTLVTAAGEGATFFRGIDVYRFREDASLEAGGIYAYVRNLSCDARWSVGYQPTKVEPTHYQAAFAVDRVTLARRDGDIETVTEIVVSPEHPVELRRFTLTNHGAAPCDLDLTTYTEIVLAPRADDIAHRAFGSLFIETEVLRERGAVLARRRARSSSEAETWAAQTLVPGDGDWEAFEYDTSRARFLGRGRGTADPAGLDGPLAGTCGVVIEPAVALRRRLTLAPGAHARLTLVTAITTSRADAIKLVETYSTPHALPRAHELAWADARVELKHLGIDAVQSHRYQRLYSAVLFPQRALRACPDPATLRPRGRLALWAHGVSGDLPIVVLRLDDHNFGDLLREVLLAHEFWRLNGAMVDLVVLNEEPAGYMQPLQDAALAALRSSPVTQVDARGGVFLRRATEMSADDRDLLLLAARVVLLASRGSLARQLRRDAPVDPAPPRPVRRNRVATGGMPSPHANGVGELSADGCEYTMTLGPTTRTPLVWCNVIANPNFGTIVSESGSGFTWYGNAQRHRLSPWSNDPLSDPSGELFYVRDEDDASTWSLTPEPQGGEATYRVTHGQGYSRFEHTRRELEHELTIFVSPSDPVKVSQLRIKNTGARAAVLSLYGIVDWVLGPSRETSRVSIVTTWDGETQSLVATNPLSQFPERHAFFTATTDVRSFSGDREEVFGVMTSHRAPAALERPLLSGSVGAGFDPCGALHVQTTVEPGATIEVAFLLGDADGLDHARALACKYRPGDVSRRTLVQAVSSWTDTLGFLKVRTPDATLDALVNRWLLYQATSCRLWGRTAFYQSSGAYGYRDQLQDVLALLHARPDLAREHILRAAARQFSAGDVQHWWHPESGEGVRTRCSDDMLWLPYVTSEYVRTTGDTQVLSETVPFLKERALTEADEDLFSTPSTQGESATLYEHCVRALDIAATSGPNDLPLMRGGDWNDGMNRVGRGGKGESVWLAWFLAVTLREFASLAVTRTDGQRARWCTDRIARLARAVDAAAWDGSWYRRAYFDDGTPLGSRSTDECRIDAIAQSWAVIAGIGDPTRARSAVDASIELLLRRDTRLMRLLWPPFDHTSHDPGYIRAYPNGVRENGGQYTHGVLWTIRALARLGQGDRAMDLFSMVNPMRHAETPEGVDRYRVEPYVVAGDVYDAKGHSGRGGWTWYTGAASWMYQVLVEDLLGVRRNGDRLELAPCIPRAWKRYELTYGALEVVVENPNGVEHGVTHVDVDGREAPTRSAPIDGKAHQVRVVMG